MLKSCRYIDSLISDLEQVGSAVSLMNVELVRHPRNNGVTVWSKAKVKDKQKPIVWSNHVNVSKLICICRKSEVAINVEAG